MIPRFSLCLQADDSGDDPGDKGDAEIDENALRDLTDGDIHHQPFEPEKRGQDCDKNIGVNREEKDLKDGIEGDQACAVFCVSPGQIVPDDHHGDAARETDQDEAHHILGIAPQKNDGQEEHQDGADHPVLDEGQAEDFVVPKYLPQFLVFHLGQRRVHHEDQSDGDGDVGGPDLELMPEVHDAGGHVSPPHADEHGEKDPQRQKSIQEGKLLGHGLLRHDVPPI